MMTPMRPISSFFAALLAATAIILVPPSSARADVFTGTFEDQNPGINTFRNNFLPATGFTTGGFSLNNNFNTTFGVWSGFSVSSKVDNAFGGNDFSHEYGAYAPLGAQGTGSGGSATYGVAFNFSRGDANFDFRLDQEQVLDRKLSVAIELVDHEELGTSRFPLARAGNPTVNARLLIDDE